MNIIKSTCKKLLDQLKAFDYEKAFNTNENSKRKAVSNLQKALCDALEKQIKSLEWCIEKDLSIEYKDRADIFGRDPNANVQVIIELDTTRADQVAKKMLSRFNYCIDIPTIYVALLYPGTKRMNVKECEKYFNYGRNILEKLNQDSVLIGVILEQSQSKLRPMIYT